MWDGFEFPAVGLHSVVYLGSELRCGLKDDAAHWQGVAYDKHERRERFEHDAVGWHSVGYGSSEMLEGIELGTVGWHSIAEPRGGLAEGARVVGTASLTAATRFGSATRLARRTVGEA